MKRRQCGFHRRNAKGAEQIMPRDLLSHEPQRSTPVILTEDAPCKSASEWRDLASAPVEATALENSRLRRCHLKRCNERLPCVNLTVANRRGPSKRCAQHDEWG